MAIFRPGPIISAVSGNLGGLNFAYSRNSSYIRKALRRTNKHTLRQTGNRALFTYLIRAWADLTNAQRIAWNAAAVTTVFHSRLGIHRNISGFQFFTKYNLPIFASTGLITLPPDNVARVPQPDALPYNFSASGVMSINWTQQPLPTPCTLLTYGSRPLSAKTDRYFNNWLFLAYFPSTAGPNNTNISAAWYAKLGAPIQGEVVAVKMRLYSADYMLSHSDQTETTVTA